MADEFAIPPAQIVELMPAHKRQAAELVGTPVGLTPRQANALSKARLNTAMSLLAEGSIEKVQKWLDQVAERNPEAAVRLFMELTEFTMPRLKAAQITANANLTPDSAKDLQSMSLEELQRVVAEG